MFVPRLKLPHHAQRTKIMPKSLHIVVGESIFHTFVVMGVGPKITQIFICRIKDRQAIVEGNDWCQFRTIFVKPTVFVLHLNDAQIQLNGVKRGERRLQSGFQQAFDAEGSLSGIGLQQRFQGPQFVEMAWGCIGREG